jgi:hypothetical protein
MLETLLKYYIAFMKLQIIKNDHLGAPLTSASLKSITKKSHGEILCNFIKMWKEHDY